MACKICPTTIAMGLLAAGGIGFAGYSMMSGECGASLGGDTAVTTSVSDAGSSCSTKLSCDTGVTLASAEGETCPLGGGACDEGTTQLASGEGETCDADKASCSEGTEQLASTIGQDSLTLVKSETADESHCQGAPSECTEKTDCETPECAAKCESDAVASNGG